MEVLWHFTGMSEYIYLPCAEESQAAVFIHGSVLANKHVGVFIKPIPTLALVCVM